MTTTQPTTPESLPTALIDDCFWVKRQRWGTFVSVHKDGHEVITSLTEEQCIATTRFYLKGLQDGWNDSNVIKHEGTVGGKL
jgi:hypothetical protein